MSPQNKIILRKILRIVVVLVFIIGNTIAFFNRAPQRNIPAGDSIVSPASGKIIGIVPVQTPVITFQKKGIENVVTIPQLSQPMQMILIEMNPLDVHVQRMPIDGQVTFLEHYDGQHKNALGKNKFDIVKSNEKTVTVITNSRESVGIIQVAGMSARRIREYIQKGDVLEKGAIYGRILLGSQVVVLIPQNRVVQAQMGDKVIDGETILAK